MNALKFTGRDTVEGLAIPFGGLFAGKDVDGEAFTPETDFCLDWFGKSGRPVLYHHGLDDELKTALIGRQVDFETREEGIWAQSQLDKRARYRKAIDKLIDEGALGYSSGSMSHVVSKTAEGRITRWPWVELSLTPVPAAGDLSGVTYAVKATDAIDHLEGVGTDLSTDFIKAALAALDNQSQPDDDLRDGESLADLLDRVADKGPAWVSARRNWHGKSGRVLSKTTRERLVSHPATLRQLADDLDELLETADAGKSALVKALLDFEMARARQLGVPLT